MKKGLLLLATMAICLFAGAQNDEMAKNILDKSAAKFKEYSSAEIHFAMLMDNDVENVHEKNVGVAYMKGNLYRLELMGVTTFFDGEYIYTYNPDAEEVTVKNPSDSEEEFLKPNELFEIHNKGFVQKYVGKDGTFDKIDLLPEDNDKSFSKLTVWVNLATSMVSKVVAYGKDSNDNITIQIVSVTKPKTVLNDLMFKYSEQAYSGAELVDLR